MRAPKPGDEVLGNGEIIKSMKIKATEIMSNIIQLAELLDDEALRNAEDIPIVELAKSVSIKKSKQWLARNNMLSSRSLPADVKPDESAERDRPSVAVQRRHHP
jgi:hypothetical protein